MKSAAAKEAIGGMLDGQVALMQSEGAPEMGGSPSTRTRGGHKGGGRGGGRGGGKGEAKTPNPDAEAAKQLQKNIKLFLGVKHYATCIP